MNRKMTRKILFYVFLICLAAVWLLPIVFMSFTAVKTPADLFGRKLFALPNHIEWRNFIDSWDVGKMGLYMKNSLIVSCLKVPLGILIESLAAFGLTRMNLKWGNKLFIFFFAGMMIPMQVTLVPLNIMLTKAGLINTYLGLFTVYVGFGIPFGILVLRGFFRAIPREMDEAARIDGCSNLALYARIIMPIAKPAVATLLILDFLSTWNEFILASVFITNDVMRTVPAGLMRFRGEFSTNYPLLSAGVLMSIIPVLIIYLTFQRYFVEGLQGSVKG